MAPQLRCPAQLRSQPRILPLPSICRRSRPASPRALALHAPQVFLPEGPERDNLKRMYEEEYDDWAEDEGEDSEEGEGEEERGSGGAQAGEAGGS